MQQHEQFVCVRKCALEDAVAHFQVLRPRMNDDLIADRYVWVQVILKVSPESSPEVQQQDHHQQPLLTPQEVLTQKPTLQEAIGGSPQVDDALPLPTMPLAWFLPFSGDPSTQQVIPHVRNGRCFPKYHIYLRSAEDTRPCLRLSHPM